MITMYETRVVQNSAEPESDWTAPEGWRLYRGTDEGMARQAKAEFDGMCDPAEGAVVTRDSDGFQLRDDVNEWQPAA